MGAFLNYDHYSRNEIFYNYNYIQKFTFILSSFIISHLIYKFSTPKS